MKFRLYNRNSYLTSEEGEPFELGNQNVDALDTSSMNLDASSDDHIQIEMITQEVGELDLNGINLDQSGDKHLETKTMNPPSSEFLAPQEIDTPN